MNIGKWKFQQRKLALYTLNNSFQGLKTPCSNSHLPPLGYVLQPMLGSNLCRFLHGKWLEGRAVLADDLELVKLTPRVWVVL